MKRFFKVVPILLMSLFFNQGCSLLLGNLVEDYSDAREKVKRSVDQKFQTVIRHRIKGEELYNHSINMAMDYSKKLVANGQFIDAFVVLKEAWFFHKLSEPSMLDIYKKYKRVLDNIDNPDYVLPDTKEIPKLKITPKLVPRQPPSLQCKTC